MFESEILEQLKELNQQVQTLSKLLEYHIRLQHPIHDYSISKISGRQMCKYIDKQNNIYDGYIPPEPKKGNTK